jgi:hypothetical protein
MKSSARFGIALVYLATLLVCYQTQAFAQLQETVPVRSAEQIYFDIPPQGLAAAIESYGATTGLQVLYDARLAVGQESTQIRGVFTPEVALQNLLNGTGLTARYTAREALIIVPVPPDHAAPAAIGAMAVKGATASQKHYYGLLQAGLKKAFCLNRDAHPIDFRTVVNLWIDPAGAVRGVRLLSSTGRPGLDRSIGDTLNGLRIGEPPAKDMSQPFTVVILPRSLAGADCQ